MRDHPGQAGAGSGIYSVQGNHRTSGDVPHRRVRRTGLCPPRRDQGIPAGRARGGAPGRGVCTLPGPLAQGRRHWAESDEGQPCDPLRPLVESGGGEPGHRPGLPYRADEKRHGTQAGV